MRETTAAIRDKPAHLFPVQPTIRWRLGSGGPTSDFLGHASGQNPANGAVVWFQLGKDFKGEAKLEILDAKGNAIAKASGKLDPDDKKKDAEKEDEDGPPKRKLEPKTGLNRFVWDLTHDGATPIAGAAVDSGSAAARVPVAPGTYIVKLTAAGQTMTQAVEVKADPRVVSAKGFMTFKFQPKQGFGEGPNYQLTDEKGETSMELRPWSPPFVGGESGTTYQLVPSGRATIVKPADLAAQETLSLRVRDDISMLSDTVARIRAIKKQTRPTEGTAQGPRRREGVAQAIRGAGQEARRDR